jgi:hypothetical protein
MTTISNLLSWINFVECNNVLISLLALMGWLFHHVLNLFVVVFLSALKLVEFELWLTSFLFPLFFFHCSLFNVCMPICNETHTNNWCCLFCVVWRLRGHCIRIQKPMQKATKTYEIVQHIPSSNWL